MGMRATKNDIIGNDGLKLYANEDIKIISSSRSCSPYTAKMYKRKTNDEDPWLSLRDHWDSPNDVMYGENRNIGHNNVRDHNDGMDVYIRCSLNCLLSLYTPNVGSLGLGLVLGGKRPTLTPPPEWKFPLFPFFFEPFPN